MWDRKSGSDMMRIHVRDAVPVKLSGIQAIAIQHPAFSLPGRLKVSNDFRRLLLLSNPCDTYALETAQPYADETTSPYCILRWKQLINHNKHRIYSHCVRPLRRHSF